MTKISVLMPVYNTPENYLREAVESILAQTCADFEFLILNDASTDDNVEKVIKSYDDKRIRYWQNDRNLGISLSRNKLIGLSRGEYLAVFDHDDVSLPERLEKQAAFWTPIRKSEWSAAGTGFSARKIKSAVFLRKMRKLKKSWSTVAVSAIRRR